MLCQAQEAVNNAKHGKKAEAIKAFFKACNQKKEEVHRIRNQTQDKVQKEEGSTQKAEVAEGAAKAKGGKQK